MKIAVCSASGQLGSAIARRLIKEIGKDNVIGIARTPEKAAALGIEIRKGDYNHKDELMEALKGVDAVLLVSGMDHPDKRIQQHRNVIEATKANAVKKIVYTSIYGVEKGNAFSPIVVSNRKTEEDVKQSGMQWAIGRNGIYIEPDLEYIETYQKEGGIINCAAEGKCGYTSRNELAYAYFKLLTNDQLEGGTYNLLGEAKSQQALTEGINKIYKTDLAYKSISVEAYIEERKAVLGEFLGVIIGGIYEGIRNGKYDGESDFEKVCQRPHQSLEDMIEEYYKQS